MNMQRLIAIVAAIAINVAVLASFHNSSATVVANAISPRRAQKVLTLPVITVRPSAQQCHELRRTPAPAAST
ncbi:MAG TPA: hypothetical protein VJ833_14865 [Rhodanobacteraceae bacterium]|nr:hypothetical protein [Rhodanobacteraceae bacterium]